MIGYKLFRIRKDGSLGSLFINRKQRLRIGETYLAEDHPTPGFAHRPGWHICGEPLAPHLSKKDRFWFVVRFSGHRKFQRPACQGGAWYIAKRMTILGPWPADTPLPVAVATRPGV